MSIIWRSSHIAPPTYKSAANLLICRILFEIVSFALYFKAFALLLQAFIQIEFMFPLYWLKFLTTSLYLLTFPDIWYIIFLEALPSKRFALVVGYKESNLFLGWAVAFFRFMISSVLNPKHHRKNQSCNRCHGSNDSKYVHSTTW